MKPVLPFVETMITQACNLSCLGCTNYSDMAHKGYVAWHDGKKQIESWLNRVSITDIGIMGGEPLINPQAKEWLVGTRELLPDTQIRFTTNGILLNRNPWVIKTIMDIGNCVFKITVHQSDPMLEKTIQKIFDSYTWQSVTEFGIQRWKTDNNVRFQINRPNHFVKSYKNDYENMAPYSSSPENAFAICCQQTCPLLFNGKIYKCSTSGLLQSTLEKFFYPNREKWEQYVSQGLGPDCSDQELQTFLENFGKPNKICSMCPSVSDNAQLDHTTTVLDKKIKWH